MEVGEFLDIALPVVYILVGVALVWLAIELALASRRARKTVTQMQRRLEPTLDHVEKITAQLEPVAPKIDPLVDRVSLTVDAANLEIMRLDQILEDVSEITDSATKTMNTVDAVTSVPLNLVGSVTEKVRTRFKAPAASEESVKLGQAKQPPAQAAATQVDEFVDAVSDAASQMVAGVQVRKVGPAGAAPSDGDSAAGEPARG